MLTRNSHRTDEVKLTPSQRRHDLFELDDCIETLGGRLTDLEFFARRLKTGQTPKRAVAEIIDQSASEILKMYLLTIDKTNLKWSTEQVRQPIALHIENPASRASLS